MHTYRKYFSLPIIVVTVLVLIGWIFDIIILKSILPGFISMNPLTAICLMLHAAGIFLLGKYPLSNIILKLIAGFTLVVMLPTLSDRFLLTEYGVDKILFTEDLNGNQMAVPTIVNLILMSIGLFLSGKNRVLVLISQLLVIFCLTLSLVYLCAYLLLLNSIIGTNAFTPMALHTTLCFILLSIASLHISPDKGFMKAITSNSLGGIMTRKALLIILVIPFLMGYLSLLGQRNNLYSTEFGIAIMVPSIAMICGIIMWYYAKTLNKIHCQWMETEQNLKLSEVKFSNAFNYSGVGMALVSPDGEWIDVNDALCNMLGYTKEEIRKLSLQKIIHQEDLNLNVLKKEEMLNGIVDSYQTEKRFIHKNGNTVSVNVTTSLVRNLDNSPKFFVTQVMDITASKMLMEELHTKNLILTTTTEDLESKMKQLEEFNQIVAHNLRGPAGSILMMIGMAAEAETELERTEMLEMLKISSQNLNETLNDLMSILEIRLNKNITFDTCNLEQLTQQVVTMLKGEIITKKAEILTNFEIKQLQYPRVYLESIFYNMISNALKYSEKARAPEIHITSKLVNNRVMLSFKDNGLGIDLNKHGHNIFKLNKVFHAGFDSKGVGLFMTKNHIETFGGTIEVKSEPQKGSTFNILLRN